MKWDMLSIIHSGTSYNTCQVLETEMTKMTKNFKAIETLNCEKCLSNIFS